MLNELSNYTKEYNAEQIITAEITAYLEADIKDKEEQVVEWTKRINEEIMQRQREIDKLKVYSNVDVECLRRKKTSMFVSLTFRSLEIAYIMLTTLIH